MTSSTTTSATTHTLEVPGALLTYDVRRNDGSTEPALLLIGSPMGAAGFGTLAGYFADRTVVTYDPRGAERSRRTDGAATSTPEEHGDDLHRIIAGRRRGPVDLFASSGGAVNALALVARHPEDVRTLVAHEPPLAALVPDPEHALAACRDIHETYQRDGMGPAMAKFIAIVSHQGPITAAYSSRPPRTRRCSACRPRTTARGTTCCSVRTCCPARPTSPTSTRSARRRPASSSRVGAESEGQLARRGAEAVAERLGTAPDVFPSDHGGFLGGEYGQNGQPEAFAARLREVLGRQA